MRFLNNLIRRRFLTSKCVVINDKKHLATVIEKRNSKFALLNDGDLKFFENLLGKSRTITDPSLLNSYNTDWLKMCKGQSKLTILPKDAQELSSILKYCYEKQLAVCPQGGNTGLVGGSVPVYDEIVISTKLMNQIIKLDEKSSILSCQSGCILQNLDEYLNKNANLMMPLDLGAKGSCHIGGNISTNAGGLRLLRYGSLKGNVLGLEVVLSNGKVLNTMHTALRKDNTGFDLNQLFIGSEGLLGIVSGVSILCPKKPNYTNVIFIAASQKTFANVIEIFKIAKIELNEIMSAFEFMDKEAMKNLNKNIGLSNPFESSISKDCVFYCLVETHGACEEHDKNKIENFFSKLISAKLCSDAIIAQNKSQFNSIWSLRERLPESLTKDGYNYKYDISLPLDRYYEIVIDLRKRLNDSKAKNIYKTVTGYGHVGDGNLHMNITSEKYDDNLFNLLEPYIFEWTKQNQGSISAEHGLGLKKRDYIYYSKSRESVDLMKSLKTILDPKMILNPYKTLPQH